MTIRSAAALLIRGALEPRLAAMAHPVFDDLISEIIDSGVIKWAADNYSTFDSHETNYTVRLVDCCQAAAEGDTRLRNVQIHYDQQQLTPAILRGLTSADKARRPDVTFQLGRATRRMECKRLGAQGQAKKYFDDGMRRFLDRAYLSDPGYMAGYVEDGNAADQIAAVNGVITQQFDPTHHLQIEAANGSAFRCKSEHADPPAGRRQKLQHYMLVVR